jgi:hypothetical protein
MRMSELLRKNIFKFSTGFFSSKFKIRERRDTFFFEEIGAEYIKRCEKKGYEKEMMEIGQNWMNIFFGQLVPHALKRIPAALMLNSIMKNLWISGGLMSDFNFSRNGDMIEIRTRDEGLTRFAGKNSLMTGFYKGILNVLFRCEIDHVDVMQTKRWCTYTFKIKSNKFAQIKTKDKTRYDRLKYFRMPDGLTLKDLLSMKILKLKENNKIYFRDRRISPIENTLFHLIGNKKILLEEVPEISYNYFKSIVGHDTSDSNKLILIKNLLQAMGWGIIKIMVRERTIVFEIINPPYGLQTKRDNWDFLIGMILGYLWLLDRRFRTTKTHVAHKYLKVKYSY